jgi:hypothetical protein
MPEAPRDGREARADHARDGVDRTQRCLTVAGLLRTSGGAGPWPRRCTEPAPSTERQRGRRRRPVPAVPDSPLAVWALARTGVSVMAPPNDNRLAGLFTTVDDAPAVAANEQPDEPERHSEPTAPRRNGRTRIRVAGALAAAVLASLIVITGGRPGAGETPPARVAPGEPRSPERRHAAPDPKVGDIQRHAHRQRRHGGAGRTGAAATRVPDPAVPTASPPTGVAPTAPAPTSVPVAPPASSPLPSPDSDEFF